MNISMKIVLPWVISLGVAFYLGHYMSSQNVKSSYANIIQQTAEPNVTKKKTLTGVDNSKSLFMKIHYLCRQLLNQSPHASNLQRIVVERCGTPGNLP